MAKIGRLETAVSLRHRCVKKWSGLDTLDGTGPASERPPQT